MLFSAKYNFVFIHIPKAAGTSVIVYLKKLISDLECVGRHHNMVSDINNLVLQNHCPCGLLDKQRKTIPEISLDKTIFLAIIRDPIEIWRSHYNWGIQKTNLYKETKFNNLWNKVYKYTGSSKTAFSGFDDFITNGAKIVSKSNRYFEGHLSTSIKNRLTLDGVFPKNLYAISSKHVTEHLPLFTNQVLKINNTDISINNKNTSNYKKVFINPPESLIKKESWYYNSEYKKYLFSPEHISQ